MKKKFLVAVLALGTVLFLASCGNSGTSTDSTGSKSTKEHVMEDALGHKVTIPANPKKIIAPYLEDYLVALKVKPEAQWTVNNNTVQTYLQSELKGVPTISYDLPYEEVLKYEPDLLMVSSSALVEGGKYDQYKKIAPTYVVKNGDNVTWRDQFLDVANVLNKKGKAEKVLKNYDQLISKTKSDLGTKISDHSAAILWITNNQVFVVGEKRGTGDLLYQNLGFKTPALVKEISEKSKDEFTQLSLEKLAGLDADYLFLINGDSENMIQNEAVWKELPAVKNNQVYTFSKDSAWLYKGPVANTQIINDVTKSLQ